MKNNRLRPHIWTMVAVTRLYRINSVPLVLQRYKWLQSQTIMSFNFSPSMCNR